MMIDANDKAPLACGCMPWAVKVAKDGAVLVDVVSVNTDTRTAYCHTLARGDGEAMYWDGWSRHVSTGVTVTCAHGPLTGV